MINEELFRYWREAHSHLTFNCFLEGVYNGLIKIPIIQK